MELRHRFTLPASVEEAWTAFYFANRIAPCFPGATLGRIDGTEFDGVLKIKLGPTPVEYEGTATFLERSVEDQRIVVEAHGKDRRGHGTIMATVSMTFAQTESGTDVESISAIEFTGQASSLSESVVSEASDRLVQRLVDCVSGKFVDGLGDPPSAQELAMTTPAKPATRPKDSAEQGKPQVAAAPEAAAPDSEQGKPQVAAAPEAAAPDSEQAEAQVAAPPETLEHDSEHAEPPAATADAVKPDPGQARPHIAAPDATDVATAPDSGVTTIGLPLLRRYGPPILGAVVVGSVISNLLRRFRR